MPNLISLVIVSIIALLTAKSGVGANPLANFGLLVVFAYLFSKMMERLRLPRFIGYVLAGVVAGHGGLGILHEKFPDATSLVESLCLMLIIFHASLTAAYRAKPIMLLRNLVSGALAALGTFMLVMGFLAPTSLPLRVKIVLGLFGATFSPVMSFANTYRAETRQSLLQTAFGGYTCALVLWGIAVPLLEPAAANNIRTALMPLVISITSILAGFVWGALSERLMFRDSSDLRGADQFIMMFLVFPCLGDLGLDFHFVALGAGLYFGLISEKSPETAGWSGIIPLVAFGLLGTRLSLSDACLLGGDGWKTVIISTAVIIFSRTTTLALSKKLIVPGHGESLRALLFLIPYGPLPVLILMRFLPAFRFGTGSGFDRFRVLSLCTTSILLMVFLTALLHAYTRIGTSPPKEDVIQ